MRVPRRGDAAPRDRRARRSAPRPGAGRPTPWRAPRQADRSRRPARPGSRARRRPPSGWARARWRRAARHAARRRLRRHSTASAPCPTWGSITDGSSSSVISAAPDPRRRARRRPSRWRRTRRTFAEPGVDVAAQAGEGQVRTQPGQLGPSAHRPGGHPRPGRPGPPGWSRPARRAGRPARGTQAMTRSSWVIDGQVLGRVHGHVGPPVEHGGLHLLDEHALAAHLPDRDVQAAVARVSTTTSSTSSAGSLGAQPARPRARPASAPARCLAWPTRHHRRRSRPITRA